MRSPARMRWPVEEMGRNSVRPSTMPRMNASTRLDKELPDGLPECGLVVGAIVPRAVELDPPLRSLPGFEKALRMDYGDDFVAPGDQAKERRGDARRLPERVERMPQHPAHRQVRVVMPRDARQAVVRRDQNHAVDLAGRRQLDDDPGAQASPEENDLSRPELFPGDAVPLSRVLDERLLRGRAFAEAVAAVVDQQPAGSRGIAGDAGKHPRHLLRVAAEIEHERRAL